MRAGFCPDGTRSRVVKMKMLSRYQSASIFQPGEAYIAKERWAHSGRLTGVAVPATSGSFLSVPMLPRNSLSLLPFHRSNHRKCEHLSPIFFFPSGNEGGGGKKIPSLYIANHDSTRLLLDTRIRVGRMGSFKRIRQPTNRRILRFQIGSCGSCGRHFLFSFSPSNEQLRRNWINLDGEKFRAEEAEQPGENFIPSGVTRGHGFVLKGWISCFRSRGYRSFREIGHSYTGPLPRITLRGGKKRKRPGAGLLKFSIVAPFPFGQEARLRKTESKYFEKIGSTEIRKSGPERNSCSSLGKRNRKVTRKRQTRREQVERKWRVAIMRFSHESPGRGNHSGRFRFDEFRWVNGESS